MNCPFCRYESKRVDPKKDRDSDYREPVLAYYKGGKLEYDLKLQEHECLECGRIYFTCKPT